MAASSLPAAATSWLDWSAAQRAPDAGALAAQLAELPRVALIGGGPVTEVETLWSGGSGWMRCQILVRFARRRGTRLRLDGDERALGTRDSIRLEPAWADSLSLGWKGKALWIEIHHGNITDRGRAVADAAQELLPPLRPWLKLKPKVQELALRWSGSDRSGRARLMPPDNKRAEALLKKLGFALTDKEGQPFEPDPFRTSWPRGVAWRTGDGAEVNPGNPWSLSWVQLQG